MGLIGRLRDRLSAPDRGGEAARAGGEARAGSAGEGDAAAVLGELVRLVAEAEDAPVSAQEIDPAADIFEYGYVDSLGVAAFLARIEARFGVRISDEELVTRGLTRLDALARHVATAAAAAGKDAGPER